MNRITNKAGRSLEMMQQVPRCVGTSVRHYKENKVGGLRRRVSTWRFSVLLKVSDWLLRSFFYKRN